MSYQQEFIDFALENGVLLFGDFTLKSGRKSPFFYNAGLYNNGKQLKSLGEYYARAIKENFGLDFDLLFGPAYKGIPLAAATAQALYDLYGKVVSFSSDRKEIKDHGEKSGFLGAVPKNEDRIILIEDVTTSGKSIAETLPKIKEAAPEAKILGLVVSLNREEKAGNSEYDLEALKQIEQDYGIQTASIISMSDVIKVLKAQNRLDKELEQRLLDYYSQYGSSSFSLDQSNL